MLKLEGVLKNDILNISTKFRAKIKEIEVRHRHVGTTEGEGISEGKRS